MSIEHAQEIYENDKLFGRDVECGGCGEKFTTRDILNDDHLCVKCERFYVNKLWRCKDETQNEEKT